jgi:hypothetical protein
MSTHYFLFAILSLLFAPGKAEERAATSDKHRGITLVAPPKPFTTDPMTELRELGADWVAVIPFGFCRPGSTEVRYDLSQWQWWGELPEGCRKTIELAHQAGLKVMLKPQIWVPGSWPGGIQFENEADWQAWERSYLAFIAEMAGIAQEMEVELFCIGTEFKESTRLRPQFWRNVAAQVRGCYEGSLVYAANWDEYPHVDFWDAVDYIGIDAYFPLSPSHTPTVAELKQAWKPIHKAIKKTQARWQKPVLFTEYGYLSVDQCAWQSWELEKRVRQTPVNQQAQANALEALYATWWDEPWWAGSFLWKWFPDMQGHEGYPERDYTPQGKQAQAVIERWFTRR